MVRTWLAYLAALISTFVFFLCYKMWVAWYCLILLLAVPVFAFILAVIAYVTLRYKTDAAYTYKMSKLYISDLLGFFKFTKHLNKDMEFIVKPVPEMPGYMPDVYGFKAKSLRKSHKPNSEIYDIRDYQLGDPVKSIHWKMSAKKDKIMVKEPLEEYGGHSRVILKLSDDRDTLDLHLGQVLFTSEILFLHRQKAEI